MYARAKFLVKYDPIIDHIQRVEKLAEKET